MSALLQSSRETQNEKELHESQRTESFQRKKNFESFDLDPLYKKGGSETEPIAMSFPLTENCHHYTHRSEVDWDIQKSVRCALKSKQSNFSSDIGHSVTAYSHFTMKGYT